VKPPKPSHPPAGPTELREQAEAIYQANKAAKKPVQAGTAALDAARIIHELEVHQIELEMQAEELRRTQAAAEVMRLRYFKLYDLAPNGYCTLSPKGQILECNLTFAHQVRTDRATLLKQVFSHCVLKEDRDRYYALVNALAQTGDPQAADFRLIGPPEAPCWIHVSALTELTDDGSIVYHLALSDITELKQSEAQLRTREQRYRSLTESAHEAIISVNTEGIIVDWNSGAAGMFGYSAAKAMGQPLTLLMPQRYQEAHRAGMARANAGDAPGVTRGDMIMVGRRWNGLEFPVLMSLSSWTVPEGKYHTAIIRDMSAWKAAEQAQIETLQLLRHFMDQFPGLAYIKDANSRVLYANERFASRLGFAVASLEGKTNRDLFPADQAAKFDENDQAALSSKETITFEETFQDRLWATSKFTIKLADGRVLLGGFSTDITTRKQTEIELKQREAVFRAIFDHAPIGISLTGNAGTLMVNAEHTRITGIPAEEASQPGIFARVSDPEDYARQQAAAKIFHAGAVDHYTVQKRYLHRDGRVQWAELTSRAFQDPTTGTRRIVTTLSDLTARKQAEALQMASEVRYRQIFDCNPVPVLLYDTETPQILEANKAAEQQYGFTREELIAKKFTDLHLAEDVGAVKREMRQATSTGKSSREWKHTRKDYTIIQVNVVTSALSYAGRSAQIALVLDITERKLFEGKSLQLQRLENLGMLAAGIAHDLNNVLAPILFAPQMLRASHPSERDLKILSNLEQSANRGVSLVKQILGFARTTGGEMQIVQVRHLAMDLMEIVENTFPKNIVIEHSIPSDLWTVRGNPTQLHQVLLNLCVNARDAMPAGGTLRLSLANLMIDGPAVAGSPNGATTPWLELKVTDTGTGIPPEVLEHIWEPFYTTKAIDKGTGLGLSTVRGIMGTHHGTIEVFTEPGHGSTFRLLLPAESEKAPNVEIPPPALVPNGQGESILLAEDETMIRDLIAGTLLEHNYLVTTCRNGQEALELFSATPASYSLLITDINMPKFSGLKLMSEVARIRPELLIISMSGQSADDDDRTDVAEAKRLSRRFIPKPFAAEALLSIVHELLHPVAKS